MSDKNIQQNTEANKNGLMTRPPVVVVMGHVDHGKSTLLDYIRKTNIVSLEAGGITQNISAYEVLNKDEEGKDRLITFLDTPGHEAFSKMRARGASAADIAILVVSAEDSVKAQTLEAYNTIIESKTPYIVAINKIDKPNANIEKVKMDLVEKGIYLEGMGGDVPFVLISSKIGTGIKELLDMVLLVADMQDFKGNSKIPATGVIIEAKREPRRGISATAIIKDGTLESGMFVACGKAIVNTRIMENFLGKNIKEATFSSPILLVGFESMPEVGSKFMSFQSKKEAENYVKEIEEAEIIDNSTKVRVEQKGKVIPLIIKTDALGTIEAIEKEIKKLNTEEISFKVIDSGVGAVNESDLKSANVNKDTVILGFNVKLDNSARDLSDALKVNIQLFDIIYKLTDWLVEIAEERRPRLEVVEVTGNLKVLRTFGETRDKQIVGGRVTEGHITLGGKVKIMRRSFEIGTGKIVGLQENKTKAKEVFEGTDCGLQIESKVDISQDDILEAFKITIK